MGRFQPQQRSGSVLLSVDSDAGYELVQVPPTPRWIGTVPSLDRKSGQEHDAQITLNVSIEGVAR
jgi:hypothetical protein